MGQTDNDLLRDIFRRQEALMREYQERTPDGIPEWPIDLDLPESQRFCRDTMSKCMDEMFEAKHHLKRAKEHRSIAIRRLDCNAFLEEMVDGLHFFVETLVLMGVDADKLHAAYLRKNAKNLQRIDDEFGPRKADE